MFQALLWWLCRWWLRLDFCPQELAINWTVKMSKLWMVAITLLTTAQKRTGYAVFKSVCCGLMLSEFTYNTMDHMLYGFGQLSSLNYASFFHEMFMYLSYRNAWWLSEKKIFVYVLYTHTHTYVCVSICIHIRQFFNPLFLTSTKLNRLLTFEKSHIVSERDFPINPP